jgi:hypothetical protein
MPLVVNSFPVDITPVEPVLPFIDLPTWEASTEVKETQFAQYATWRYSPKDEATGAVQNGCRLVLLNGPSAPIGAQEAKFDLGRFWRIGNILAEQSLSQYFSQNGFSIEVSHFERFALHREASSPDDAIELATGISFSARRPFRDEPYRFAVSFQWVVQAHFKETLENEALSRMSLGMPVLYKPRGNDIPKDLSPFRNRYLGRVRAIDASGTATVMCKDDTPRSLARADLRLEASPAVIKLYEEKVRSRSGPSNIIRTIQRLKKSYTQDNRRSVTVLRDRLEAIRLLLQESGSSRDQLVIALASFQSGSVSITLAPMEATFGGSW